MKELLINDTMNTTIMPYDEAIDLVCKLNFNIEEDWYYTAEIDATTGKAKIAVYDEDKIKLGYL